MIETLSFVILPDQHLDVFGDEIKQDVNDVISFCQRFGGNGWNKAHVICEGYRCIQLDMDFDKKVDAAKCFEKLEDMFPERIYLTE